jgi:hypothetical protein
VRHKYTGFATRNSAAVILAHQHEASRFLHPTRKEVTELRPSHQLVQRFTHPCSCTLVLRISGKLIAKDSQRLVSLMLFSEEHAEVVAQVRQFRMRME